VVLEPGLVTTEEAAITVLTAPGPDDGRTVRAKDGNEVEIAVRPRPAAFEELLVRTLDQVGPDAALASPPAPVGDAEIRYDGGTCTYDGPASVPVGRMRFTFETTDPPWTGAVVGLTGELSIEKIIAWLEAHPGSTEPVPGVGQATPVQPGGTMYVDVASPQIAVVCASDAGVLLPAGTVTVE
jgi:hypothetical protein